MRSVVNSVASQVLFLKTMNMEGKVAFRARCISCGWAYTFHTSKKQGYAFDANNRFVHGMRSLGKGHTAAKRFCALMNMPPPPQPIAYRVCNIVIAKVVKTMKDAATELRNNQLKEVNQCAVSCDGTWQ